MIDRATYLVRLRWVLPLLCGLLWATMGSAAVLAERSDFRGQVLAAKAPRALRVSPFEA